jgi:hypothetical protein
MYDKLKSLRVGERRKERRAKIKIEDTLSSGTHFVFGIAGLFFSIFRFITLNRATFIAL